jgi:hypothetical protein
MMVGRPYEADNHANERSAKKAPAAMKKYSLEPAAPPKELVRRPPVAAQSHVTFATGRTASGGVS